MSLPSLLSCLAFSLIKFSELHESIKAVRLKISLTLTGTEACLRPGGQAAVIVQSEGLYMALTVALFFED